MMIGVKFSVYCGAKNKPTEIIQNLNKNLIKK
jgi:hypothetical protein